MHFNAAKVLPGELLAQVVAELLQRAADICLAGTDVHHQLARLQMDGDLNLAQRRRVEANSRALLLLTDLKMDAIFQQAGELIAPLRAVGRQDQRLRWPGNPPLDASHWQRWCSPVRTA
ncbi:MAG: hypothetical protein K0R86_2452 [Enterobacter kobei]|nr:hypothetical protein [Enterobacter kobei]